MLVFGIMKISKRFMILQVNNIFSFKLLYKKGVYAKKGNYQDLAWKVFFDVEDQNIFLKTLYYPRLAINDYYILNHFFEEQYKKTATRTRINYGLSLASVLGTWSIAYSMKFKRSSFISLTLLTAFATFKGLEYMGTNSLQRKLNAKACDVSRNYPEIKFSNVVYTSSSEVAKKTLPLY